MSAGIIVLIVVLSATVCLGGAFFAHRHSSKSSSTSEPHTEGKSLQSSQGLLEHHSSVPGNAPDSPLASVAATSPRAFAASGSGSQRGVRGSGRRFVAPPSQQAPLEPAAESPEGPGAAGAGRGQMDNTSPVGHPYRI